MTKADKNGLRLMVYDRTCTGRGVLPGLTHSWVAGARLYAALGRLDAWYGAASWAEALDFLVQVGDGQRIQEIQYWGHGHWGRALIASDVLNLDSLVPDHAHHSKLEAIAERLDEASLWWFRTCETFATAEGHRFASAFANMLGARVAGHTYMIGLAQSGLHTLRPGEAPSWSTEEGVVWSASKKRNVPRWSRFYAPHTVSFLSGAIPARFDPGR